jgi:hypothetical protein
MADSQSSRARWSLSSIVWPAISAVVSFLAILVGLLTAKNPSDWAWIVGVIAALAVGVLTLFQTRGADRQRTGLLRQVTTLLSQVTTLQRALPPSVELLEPLEGAGSHDSVMKIRGRVFIEGLPDNAAGSILKDRDLRIVPFVMPVTTTDAQVKKWYSQDPVIVNEANGEFCGSVRIGMPEYGAREDFEIVVAILPKTYTPKRTDKPFDELPGGIVAASDPRTVSRLD